MVWGRVCLNDIEHGPSTLERNYTLNCGSMPLVAGQCFGGGANDVLMDMCGCQALCPRNVPIQDYGPAFFCDQDNAFFAYVYPTVGTFVIFLTVTMITMCGTVMAHYATRDDHMEVTERIGCCRMAQGGFSLFCVAAVFEGLGLLNYIGQRGSEVHLCADSGPVLTFGYGYGFLLVFVSWALLGFACQSCKEARDIHDDLSTPEPEEADLITLSPNKPARTSAVSPRNAGGKPPAAGGFATPRTLPPGGAMGGIKADQQPGLGSPGVGRARPAPPPKRPAPGRIFET